ncbi:MAG TPA: radical SAM protein, partial [candidate division WWE3 bacterium]|nr:radical SAM protein [candidate division WWE3 bacterium]
MFSCIGKIFSLSIVEILINFGYFFIHTNLYFNGFFCFYYSCKYNLKAMNRYNVNLKLNKKGLKSLIKHLSTKEFSSKEVEKILRKYPKKEGGVFSKSQVLLAYKTLIKNKDLFLNKEQEEFFLLNIRMKKVRTLSGVVPVAVLTKPFPCPGRCIFCPNDVKMPKSYLSSEPGALRALSNKFDPYLQTYNRLVALKNIGHTVQKIEIIILGGTWSSYPKSYQIWFIKRCFDALNDFNKDSSIIKKEMSYEEPLDVVKKQELPKEKTYNLAVSKKLLSNKKHQNQEKATLKELMLAHKKNETAYARCVGLVIETRPDVVNKEEVIWLRTLGVTKVQIGVQSTSNKVLKLNKRDHLLETSEEAVNLLRRMGFKIHLHWMCNLYGSNPQKDK